MISVAVFLNLISLDLCQDIGSIEAHQVHKPERT